jgi:ArsR family transcriptional regulator, arsenate/arsenite/antimonite-responsive transcriptional repressor
MRTPEAVDALGALAHEHRLAIYRLLVERGPDGLAAGVIAERLGIAPSSLTFHLQHLRRASLIAQRRVSRQLIYAADFARMNELVEFLTENCCGGNPSVCLPCVRQDVTQPGLASHRESADDEKQFNEVMTTSEPKPRRSPI